MTRNVLLVIVLLAATAAAGTGIAYTQGLTPSPQQTTGFNRPFPDASPTPIPATPPLRPTQGSPAGYDVSPPLSSLTPIPPQDVDATRLLPRMPLPRPTTRAPDAFSGTPSDPVVQAAPGQALMPATTRNFDGVSNVDNVLPPDTNGDVGPNHYVQWVNLSFAVWDKNGTLLYGPAAGKTLWTGFGGPCESENDGDPIALYDPLADRWMMSQFALPNYPGAGPFYQCIAVSQTADPTGAYYRYAFLVSNTKMNDYPKFGVWPDGYYMSVNQFGSSGSGWAGAGVFVFERAKMLTGQNASFQYFDLYSVNSSYGGMLPSDLDGANPPPSGTPNYFIEADDSSNLPGGDAIRIWAFHVDWNNPSNSTFGVSGQPNSVLSTAGFDPRMCEYARNCIPQPDTAAGLDALSDQIMYRVQYRNFGTHQSIVLNQTVDAGNDHAGIRWYELRRTSGDWSIYQQGTYAPDSSHRWMGGIAMDGRGNIALGYSVSSSSVYPSIRYTGRLVSDTLGAMTQAEGTIVAGSGSQTSSYYRWGDYSMMALDPADDCTFWYTQEYYQTTSSRGWRTRIASFKFPSCTSGPNLVTSALTASNDTVRPGNTLTYTIAINNSGDITASSRITDVLPAFVTYVPGSLNTAGAYTPATRAVTWSGSVAAGNTFTLTYSVAVESPLDNATVITNTATIYDGANAPFETTAVSSTVTSSPNLTTSNWASTLPFVRPGGVITYSLTLTNTGDMNASGVNVTDTLPASLSFDSGGASAGVVYVPETRSVSWGGAVAVGIPQSIAFRAVASASSTDGTAITNTSTIYDGLNTPFVTTPANTIIDARPPSGSLSLNSGVTYANATDTILSLSATDNVSGPLSMALANDGANWGDWLALSPSVSWRLSSGDDGSRTVYARFLDGAGNVSPAYSDTITLDTGLPSGGLSINGGAPDTNSPQVALGLSAQDYLAGVFSMQLSTDGQSYGAWETYATTKALEFSGGDGTKTAYVRFQDNAGNVSVPVSSTIILNQVPPSSAVSSLSAYLNSAQVPVSWSGLGFGSGLAAFDVQYRDGEVGAWADYVTNTLSTSAVFAGAEGHTYYFRSRARDKAGNLEILSGADGDTHTTIDLTPPAGAMGINSGALDTTALTVTLTPSMKDVLSAVSDASYSNDATNWSPWEAYSSTTTWSLPVGDGRKTVWARFKDLAGNQSSAVSQTIRLDSSMPSNYGISIASGAAYVNRPRAVLYLPARGSTASMMLSNDAGFAGAAWEPYATHRAWPISENGSYGLPATVYARYQDVYGAVSGPFSDDVILDNGRPTGSIVIGAVSLDAGGASTGTATAEVALSAGDDLSGIGGMMLSNSPAFTGAVWEPFQPARTWRMDSTGRVYVVFTDTAGNASAVYSTSLSGSGQTMPPPVLTTVHPETGGQIESSETGTTISFPPESFSAETRVTLVPAAEPDLEASTGTLRGISRYLTITAVAQESAVIALNKPYTITVGYAGADTSWITEATLAIYWWDGGAWQRLPSNRIDTTAKTVSATVDHFSSFAVLGESSMKNTYLPLVLKGNGGW